MPESRITVAPPATLPIAHYTFVLVHGAWAGGWEWKKVGDALQRDGHTAYRPTLTGQGERVHLASPDVDLNTHIQDIVNVILFENLHDVVLMGHSYGGMVITGVADRIPDRIKCLVYVDAFLPEDGDSVYSITTHRFSATNGFIQTPFKIAANQSPPYIVPMSEKIFDTKLMLKNPKAATIPATYIVCKNPGVTLEKSGFYRFYLRAIRQGYFTETINSDHVVNQSHPKELVKLLEAAPARAKINSAK